MLALTFTIKHGNNNSNDNDNVILSSCSTVLLFYCSTVKI